MILIGVSFSCSDDFLERLPQGDLTTGSYPENETDALLATNAIYNTMRIWNFHSGGFPILDIQADDATKGTAPGDGTAMIPYETFTNTADEGSMDRWWRTLYQGIRRSHLVILNVPDVDMDPTLRDRLVGEARFLRAYFYSILVRAFGDVPKVLEITPALDAARSPAEEIWQEIIFPDLDFALASLPEKTDYNNEDMGRATKGAVRGLLARLHLYRSEFDLAEQYALEVINSGVYDLEPEYANAFSETNEHGVESVFEIGALRQAFDQGGNQYGNTWAVRGTPNRGWGFGRPAYSFITDHLNDPRLDDIVLYLGEELDGVVISGDGATPDTTYSSENPTEITEIECYNQKVWTPGTDTQSSFGFNKRVIRYADVLLMAAEALNENGNTTQALTYLNEVRARARAGDPTALPDITSTDQGTVRQAIYDERRIELSLEGLRLWDLIRTGQAPTVLGPLGFREGVNELFPIPQSEIDISEGRITQNEGYN